MILTLLRNPYVIGVLAVILVGGIQQGRVWKSQVGESRAIAELAHREAAWQASLAAGQEAARRAVEASVSRERELAASRVQAEQEASERLRESAKTSAREANEWRQRYREAVATDASCREWSEQKVACPLPRQ